MGDYSDELLNTKDPEYPMSTPIVRGDWFGDFCYQSKQTNYMYPHHHVVERQHLVLCIRGDVGPREFSTECQQRLNQAAEICATISFTLPVRKQIIGEDCEVPFIFELRINLATMELEILCPNVSPADVRLKKIMADPRRAPSMRLIASLHASIELRRVYNVIASQDCVKPLLLLEPELFFPNAFTKLYHIDKRRANQAKNMKDAYYHNHVLDLGPNYQRSNTYIPPFSPLPHMPSYSDLHALSDFLGMTDLKPTTPYIQRGNDMLDRLRYTAQTDSSFPYILHLPGLKEVHRYLAEMEPWTMSRLLLDNKFHRDEDRRRQVYFSSHRFVMGEKSRSGVKAYDYHIDNCKKIILGQNNFLPYITMENYRNDPRKYLDEVQGNLDGTGKPSEEEGSRQKKDNLQTNCKPSRDPRRKPKRKPNKGCNFREEDILKMKEFFKEQSKEGKSPTSPALSISNSSSVSTEYAECPVDPLNHGWDQVNLPDLLPGRTEGGRRDSTSSKAKYESEKIKEVNTTEKIGLEEGEVAETGDNVKPPTPPSPPKISLTLTLAKDRSNKPLASIPEDIWKIVKREPLEPLENHKDTIIVHEPEQKVTLKKEIIKKECAEYVEDETRYSDLPSDDEDWIEIKAEKKHDLKTSAPPLETSVSSSETSASSSRTPTSSSKKSISSLLDRMMSHLDQQVNMTIPDEILTSPQEPGKPSTPGKSSTPGRATPGTSTPGRATPGTSTPGRATPGRSSTLGKISKRPRVKPVKLEAKFKELLPALPEKIFSEDDSDSDKKDKI